MTENSPTSELPKPVDPALQRYKRIAWFLTKSLMLFVVFVFSVCVSPWLAAQRRDRILEATSSATGNVYGMSVMRGSESRVKFDTVIFPFRPNDFARYSSAAVYALDRAQTFFEDHDFRVVDRIYLNGRNEKFDSDLEQFSQCQWATMADLREVDFSSHDLSPLTRIDTLERVQFFKCRLNDEAVRNLAEIDGLRHLFFFTCDFTADGYAALAELQQTHWINLVDIKLMEEKLTPDDLKPLRESLPNTCVSFLREWKIPSPDRR